MPKVVCIYCGYVGKGRNINNQTTDVLAHEINCRKNPLREFKKELDKIGRIDEKSLEV